MVYELFKPGWSIVVYRSKKVLVEYTQLDQILALTVKHNVLFILDNVPVTFIAYL